MSGPVDFLTGRALPFGYTADTAPAGMRWVYDALAPAPGTLYGDVLPVKREADGRIGFAMPNAMREGLLGLADLLSGTETGELTGRGAAAFAMGGFGAGGTMAPRGALAAGGAKASLPDSLAIPDILKRKPAMPPVVNVARVIDSGFLPNQRLYHWTDAPDFPAFAYGSSRARSLGLPQAGFWAAEDPKYLEDMARLVGRPDGTGSRVIPLVPRYSNHASVTLQPGFTHLAPRGQDRLEALPVRPAFQETQSRISATLASCAIDGASKVHATPVGVRSPHARIAI